MGRDPVMDPLTPREWLLYREALNMIVGEENKPAETKGAA